MIKTTIVALATLIATAAPSHVEANDIINVYCFKNGKLLWEDVFYDYRAAQRASDICRRIGGTPDML
ncbi:hypothetical protein A7985_07690 [Pseudoalteromonas luteoviolacea]|uniref:Uncharacterized protein n=1 Tax=Pseudoalteromonas luteoviolacea TaxID=43657 RepID=A0A1C0TWW7_9GAMM|nr:hypothetical protein [Pseudoalteromonas luteoviolacea]MBQ4810318.1 hypothetical protein [Pseudoalteromonas luteoviolacea]OCQ23811.1 hypothetical protein A7985_07690 [Pseudoalteromonas luteoviolacea]